MDKDFLRLITWAVMDGTIVHKSDFNKRVQFPNGKPQYTSNIYVNRSLYS